MLKTNPKKIISFDNGLVVCCSEHWPVSVINIDYGFGVFIEVDIVSQGVGVVESWDIEGVGDSWFLVEIKL